MEATEVAKKVVDLIQAGAEQVGQTAKEAWPHIVHFTYAKAITGLVLCGVWTTIFLLCLSVWIYLSTREEKFLREHDEVIGFLFVSSGLVGLFSFVGAIISLAENLPNVLEPVGATIMDLVKRL